MTRARLLVFLAAMLLIAAGLALWQFAAPGAAPGGGESRVTTASRSVPGPVTSPPPPQAPALDDTPIHVRLPDSTPIATVVKELQSAADLGNARAACRLALELSKCQFLGSNSSAEEKTRCEGVSFEDAARTPHYLWQSALSGNIAAMSRYARDPALSYTDPAENAEAWLQYKQNAESFLARAVQGGDVMALYMSWWYAATGLSAGGRQMFHKDPYMASVYGSAVAPLLDARRLRTVNSLNAKMESSLTADQIAKARAEGQRIRDTYFAGAPRTEDTMDDGYMLPAQCDN